jgi:archaemetzincin
VTLRIVPVGEGVSVELLDGLAAALALRLQVGCHVDTAPLNAGFAWEQKRNQYWSTALLKALVERTPDDVRVLGVTELDLYVPVLTFVFGEAQVAGRAALVSMHRLRNEFYGLAAAPDILLERLVKEAIHELGHTYGLRHCSDWRCVMSSSHAVEKLDTKGHEFCDACARMRR